MTRSLRSLSWISFTLSSAARLAPPVLALSFAHRTSSFQSRRPSGNPLSWIFLSLVAAVDFATLSSTSHSLPGFRFAHPSENPLSWILAFRRSCIPFRNSSNFCIPSPDFTWGVHFVQPRQNTLSWIIGSSKFYHSLFFAFAKNHSYRTSTQDVLGAFQAHGALAKIRSSQ